MTTALETMKAATDKAMEGFSKETPILTEPSVDYRRRMDAYSKANLDLQMKMLEAERRASAVIEAGFIEHSLDELVEMLMGDSPTDWMSEGSASYRDPLSRGSWGNTSYHTVADRHYTKNRDFRTSHWYTFDWEYRSDWECRVGHPDELTTTIPYGVALRMKELEKEEVFNFFQAIAPFDAWKEKPVVIDPILIGVIVPMNNPNVNRRYFFVAQW